MKKEFNHKITYNVMAETFTFSPLIHIDTECIVVWS